ERVGDGGQRVDAQLLEPYRRIEELLANVNDVEARPGGGDGIEVVEGDVDTLADGVDKRDEIGRWEHDVGVGKQVDVRVDDARADRPADVVPQGLGDLKDPGSGSGGDFGRVVGAPVGDHEHLVHGHA